MLRLAIQFPTLSITSVKLNLMKFSKSQPEFSLKSSKYRRLWILMNSVPCKLQTKGQICISNAIRMERTALRPTVMESSTICCMYIEESFNSRFILVCGDGSWQWGVFTIPHWKFNELYTSAELTKSAWSNTVGHTHSMNTIVHNFVLGCLIFDPIQFN